MNLDNSNTSEAQMRRMVAAMRIRPQSTEDFRKLGIFQVSARIFGLRKQGYVIETQPIEITDRDGFPHRGVGLYHLIEEPVGEVLA